MRWTSLVCYSKKNWRSDGQAGGGVGDADSLGILEQKVSERGGMKGNSGLESQKEKISSRRKY